MSHTVLNFEILKLKVQVVPSQLGRVIKGGGMLVIPCLFPKGSIYQAFELLRIHVVSKMST